MIKSLQSLRFIFIFLIFLHHFPVNGEGLFEAGGAAGVSFFFILSGFVISMGYDEKIRKVMFSYRSFLWRRIAKVYPLHLLFLLGWMLLNYKGLFSLHSLVLLPNMLLLQSWIPVSDIYFSGNPLSWFLSDMLFFYAMFPFIFSVMQRISLKGKYWAFTVMLIIYFIGVDAIPQDWEHPLLYISPLFRLIDFIIGMLMYDSYKVLSGKKEMMKSIMCSGYGLKTLAESLSVLLFAGCVLLYYVVPSCYNLVSLFWIPSSIVIFLFAILDNSGGVLLTFYN